MPVAASGSACPVIPPHKFDHQSSHATRVSFPGLAITGNGLPMMVGYRGMGKTSTCRGRWVCAREDKIVQKGIAEILDGREWLRASKSAACFLALPGVR